MCQASIPSREVAETLERFALCVGTRGMIAWPRRSSDEYRLVLLRDRELIRQLAFVRVRQPDSDPGATRAPTPTQRWPRGERANEDPGSLK
jgi:hypothetical protein